MEVKELTWHDFSLRKMSSEEVVIGSNILVAHGIILEL